MANKGPKEIAHELLHAVNLNKAYFQHVSHIEEDFYCLIEKDAFEGLLEDLFVDDETNNKIKQAFMMSFVHDFGFNYFKQGKERLQDLSFIANNVARSEIITEGRYLDLVLNTWHLFFEVNAQIASFDVKTSQTLKDEADNHNITLLEFNREIRLYRRTLSTDLALLPLNGLKAFTRELKDMETNVRTLNTKINRSQMQIPEAFTNYFSAISEQYDAVYYEVSKKLAVEIEEKKKDLQAQIKIAQSKDRRSTFKKFIRRATLRLAFVFLSISGFYIFLQLYLAQAFYALIPFPGISQWLSGIHFVVVDALVYLDPYQGLVYVAFMTGLILLVFLFASNIFHKATLFIIWLMAFLGGMVYGTHPWTPFLDHNNNLPLAWASRYFYDHVFMVMPRFGVFHMMLAGISLLIMMGSIRYTKVKRLSYFLFRLSLLILGVVLIMQAMVDAIIMFFPIEWPFSDVINYGYLTGYLLLFSGALFSFFYFLPRRKKR